MNEAPSSESEAGLAPAGDAVDEGASPCQGRAAKYVAAASPFPSSIAVARQAASVIDPACLPATAAAPENDVVPKFASGSVRQRPYRPQDEGASTIHSADERPGDPIVTSVEEAVCLVRFSIRSETRAPRTSIDALTLSPGPTRSPSRTGAAGRSSYHALWVARPEGVQSASVPICSSPVSPSANPPRPTQSTEKAGPRPVQEIFGTTQLPDTCVNGLADVTATRRAQGRAPLTANATPWDTVATIYDSTNRAAQVSRWAIQDKVTRRPL